MKILLSIVLFLILGIYGFLLYNSIKGHKIFRKPTVEGIAHLVIATMLILVAIVVRYM